MTTTSTRISTTNENEPTLTILLSGLIALLAYYLTTTLVPFLSNDLVEKGLKGRDMLKVGFTRKKDEELDEREQDLPGTKWM